MFPPHLPPPTCNVKRHQQWQRIKILLVSTFFGLLAGLTGAAITIGWIWPTVSSDWITSRFSSSISRDALQNRAENKIADKVYSIYKKASFAGAARYFSPEDIVSDGVMSVTSGWLVTYIPNFEGKTKDWMVVGQNGSIFKIERSLNDPRTNFVFFKIVPVGEKPAGDDQFKVATFKTELKKFDSVYVYEDSKWLSTAVTGKISAHSENHLDSVPPSAYVLTDPFRNGTVAIDKDGDVVGFIADNKYVRPFYAANFFLNGIEEKSKLSYPTLGVEGWFSEEKMLVINEEIATGFIVTKVAGNRNVFQKGDVILEINGREANWDNLWYTISINNKVSVKFLRGQSTLEKEVSILQI